MSLLDDLPTPPDEQLRRFLLEYETTGGRMRQDDRHTTKPAPGGNPVPIRPRYYGRQPSNRLHQARTARLMSQTELAARTGSTRRTISETENQRREPSVYLALAIAEALGTAVEDIFQLAPLTPVPPSKF